MEIELSLFLCLCANVLGYNLHINSSTTIVHQRASSGSMFGFAVQAHVNGSESMILVGAPNADSVLLPDVEKPGAVYKCDPHTPNSCTEIDFGVQENTKGGRTVIEKDHQWFGATITTSGSDGDIVACAPRQVYLEKVIKNEAQNNDYLKRMVGSCYIEKSSKMDIGTTTANEGYYSPCVITNSTKGKPCEAGISAAIFKDSKRLFIGAPGHEYCQGATFSLKPGNASEGLNITKTRDLSIIKKKRYPDNSNYNETYNEIYYNHDSYMGYSMTVGYFSGKTNKQEIAIGIPRWQNLKGKVALYTYTSDFQSIKNITSRSSNMTGAYFGYSLAAGDIDGDEFDDVIVGAPMFTDPEKRGYEHGSVHIFYRGKNIEKSKNGLQIKGEVARGRFGLSVASLGDIDLDGFGDFAVGAPYGGQNGRGIVFIYLGRGDRNVKEYSQAIAAEEISSPPISTFGFSLSGGVDLDNNNYTDLIVGAYKNDSVVYISFDNSYTELDFLMKKHKSTTGLPPVITTPCGITSEKKEAILKDLVPLMPKTRRAFWHEMPINNAAIDLQTGGQLVMEEDEMSRPIIKVSPEVKFKNPVISLENDKCVVNNITVVCEDITFCLEYQGGYEESTFNVSIDLDSEKLGQNKRLRSIDVNITRYVTEINVNRSKKECKIVPVFIYNDIRNNLSPIHITMTFDLVLNYPEDVIPPIIDRYNTRISKDSIRIQHNCGSDNVCTPDLKVTASSTIIDYIYGSSEIINIDVKIENSGEDANNPVYYLYLGAGVSYAKMSILDNSQEHPVNCTEFEQQDNGNSTIQCDLGNLMTRNEIINFRISLQINPNVKSLDFNMEVKSFNQDDSSTVEDNRFHFSINVICKGHVSIFGISNPSKIFFNASQYDFPIAKVTEDTQLGPRFEHKYLFMNEGPCTVEEAEIFLVWPYQSLSGDNLMYVITKPDLHPDTHIQCDEAENINPLNLLVHPSNDRSEGGAPRKKRDGWNRGDIPDSELEEVNTDNPIKATNDTNYDDEFSSSNDRYFSQNEILKKCEDNFKCGIIKCNITKPMPKGQELWLKVRARFNATKINEISTNYTYNLTTAATFRINKLPINRTDGNFLKKYSAEVKTVIISNIEPVLPDAMKLWMIILAVVIAVLLLILSIYGLYRCGFFKRNRPPVPDAIQRDHTSTQPDGTLRNSANPSRDSKDISSKCASRKNSIDDTVTTVRRRTSTSSGCDNLSFQGDVL